MYEIRLARRAEHGLRQIRRGDPPGYRRVVAAIRALADDPRPPGAAKLTGFDPPAWRIRIGDYRVVYEIREAELLILVVNVVPRADVYR